MPNVNNFLQKSNSHNRFDNIVRNRVQSGRMEGSGFSSGMRRLWRDLSSAATSLAEEVYRIFAENAGMILECARPDPVLGQVLRSSSEARPQGRRSVLILFILGFH